MRPTILMLATALALGALSGCDRKPEERAERAAAPNPNPPASNSPASSGGTAGTTPNSPGSPVTPAPGEEKGTGAQPPVQGQVDPREGEQHKDFQQRGDGAGPKPSSGN